MHFVGRVVSTVSEFYKEINPATLSGAIDVVVVERRCSASSHDNDGEDDAKDTTDTTDLKDQDIKETDNNDKEKDNNGNNYIELACSPFHVRFGKLKLLRPHEKVVEIRINNKIVDLHMKVGEAGEAFFVVESELPVPFDLATSPIQSPNDPVAVDEPLLLDGVLPPSTTETHTMSVSTTDVASATTTTTTTTTRTTTKVSAPSEADQNPDQLYLHEISADLPPSASSLSLPSSAPSNDSDDLPPTLAMESSVYLAANEHIDPSPTSPLHPVSPQTSPLPLYYSMTVTEQLLRDSDSFPATGPDEAHYYKDVRHLTSENASTVDSGISSTSPSVAGGAVMDFSLGPMSLALSESNTPGNRDRVRHMRVQSASASLHSKPSLEMNPMQGIIDKRNPLSDTEFECETDMKENSAEDRDGSDTSPNSNAGGWGWSWRWGSLPTKVQVKSDGSGGMTVVDVKVVDVKSKDTRPDEMEPTQRQGLVDVTQPLHRDKDELQQTSLTTTSQLSPRKSSTWLSLSKIAELQSSPADFDPSAPSSSAMVLHPLSASTAPSSVILATPVVHEDVRLPSTLPSSIQLSLCGWSPNRGPDFETMFQKHRVSLDQMELNPGLLMDPNLCVRFKETLEQSEATISMSSEASTRSITSNDINSGTLSTNLTVSPKVVENLVQSLSDLSIDTTPPSTITTIPSSSTSPSLLPKSSSPVAPSTASTTSPTPPTPSEIYLPFSVAQPYLLSCQLYNKPISNETLRLLLERYVRDRGEEPKYRFGQGLRQWWSRGGSGREPKDKESHSGSEDSASKSLEKKHDIQQRHLSDPERDTRELIESDALSESAVSTAGTIVTGQSTIGVVKTTKISTAYLSSSNFAKTLRLTSEQLKSLNLEKGANTITFSVTTKFQGTQTCTAKIFFWDENVRIVISDIDGTITKSDALGHLFTMVGRDWTHSGVASLYTNIVNNGYRILYLTSRAIGQANYTREYLKKVEQGQYQLPDGPVIMSPDRLMRAFHREVIQRRPEEFKIACLRDIKRLFSGKNPFYAGFGNRITDALSYRAVDVPASRVFTIDTYGDIKLELLSGYKSSYVKLNDIVDQIFPPITRSIASEFNDFNFWKAGVPQVEIDMSDFIVEDSSSSDYDDEDDEDEEDEWDEDDDGANDDGNESPYEGDGESSPSLSFYPAAAVNIDIGSYPYV